MVPGAPHSMYWEAPGLFNAALERALETVYPGSATAAPAPPAELPSPARG
jgi:3-oxoadipate enol-lactonase